MPGPLHLDVQHPCRTIDCPSRQRREAEEAIEENETVGIVVEPTTAEESSTALIHDAMENDAENDIGKLQL